MKQISGIPRLCRNMCSTSFAVHNTSTPPNFSGPSYQQCHQQCPPLRLELCLPLFLQREHLFSFFIRLQQHKQTNAPRLAAGMALFQPRDWFSAAQLSLSLAIRIVCQKMDECNLLKSIPTVFHISIEEKLFLDSYL